MAYSRRDVTDHVTVMNKDLYDNLQDGIDENKKELEESKKVHEELEKKFDDYVSDEELPNEVKRVVLSDILVI